MDNKSEMPPIEPKEINPFSVSLVNELLGFTKNKIPPSIKDLPKTIDIKKLWLMVQNNLFAYPPGQETFIGIGVKDARLVITGTNPGYLRTDRGSFADIVYNTKQEKRPIYLTPSVIQIDNSLIKLHTHPQQINKSGKQTPKEFFETIPINWWGDALALLSHPDTYVAITIDKTGPPYPVVLLIKTEQTPKKFSPQDVGKLIGEMSVAVIRTKKNKRISFSTIDQKIGEYGVGIYRGFIDHIPTQFENNPPMQLLRKRNQ